MKTFSQFVAEGRSAAARRTKNAVENQRQGYHGDSHALDSAMKDTQKSVDRLNKSDTRVTRASADIAGRKVASDVKKANKYGPQQSSDKPFGQRIEKPPAPKRRIGVQVKRGGGGATFGGVETIPTSGPKNTLGGVLRKTAPKFNDPSRYGGV